MPTLSRTSLSRIFLGGLAVAGNACASNAPPPEEPTDVLTGPTASPTASSNATGLVTATPPKLGMNAYAAEFQGVDYAKAMPAGTELLGFIDIDNGTPTCSTGPCSKEWQSLALKSGAHSAVVRRAGTLEVIMLSDFAAVIGPVDSPEKAALRARMDDYRKPGRCSDFSKAGFACGTAGGDGVPVRKTETGFEVVTFGSRDVCADIKYGYATVIGIVSISREGNVGEVENDLTKAIDDEAVAGVECRYPRRGRMFEGFVDCADERSELEYFLRAAHQEAAAVVAFERLARELSLHGAPRALIADAERSAQDERRHARLFRREADRIAAALGIERGALTAAPAPLSPRPLRAVLEENAAEGCVNETYAAVVATHQATAAERPRVRRLFAAIAADEQRHAALAFRVHAWGVERVNGAARLAIAATLERATCEMLGARDPGSIGRAMGEPESDVAAAAFRHVSNALRAA